MGQALKLPEKKDLGASSRGLSHHTLNKISLKRCNTHVQSNWFKLLQDKEGIYQDLLKIEYSRYNIKYLPIRAKFGLPM